MGKIYPFSWKMIGIVFIQTCILSSIIFGIAAARKEIPQSIALLCVAFSSSSGIIVMVAMKIWVIKHRKKEQTRDKRLLIENRINNENQEKR